MSSRLILAVLLAAAACAAGAQDSARLLFAAPGIQGADAGAVLIALPAGGGHAGLILNRWRDAKLAEVLPENPKAAKVVSPIGFGGTLGRKIVFALTPRDPGEGTRQLAHGVYMATGSEAIDRIVERMPVEARFFSGMMVWLPGELDAQIDAGKWIVTHPDASTVFHRSPEAMWDELAARLGNTATAAAW
jgi:putative AlgH/UPF0301 family transcriptional regulator